MNKGTAMAIFLQIDSDKFTDEEKTEAIYFVMNMATHNSIKKDNMLAALKWLWHQQFEWTEIKKPTNYDRIKAMSKEEMAELLCGCSDCTSELCYGKDLCRYGQNGCLKWLESEVTE